MLSNIQPPQIAPQYPACWKCTPLYSPLKLYCTMQPSRMYYALQPPQNVHHYTASSKYSALCSHLTMYPTMQIPQNALHCAAQQNVLQYTAPSECNSTYIAFRMYITIQHPSGILCCTVFIRIYFAILPPTKCISLHNPSLTVFAIQPLQIVPCSSPHFICNFTIAPFHCMFLYSSMRIWLMVHPPWKCTSYSKGCVRLTRVSYNIMIESRLCPETEDTSVGN